MLKPPLKDGGFFSGRAKKYITRARPDMKSKKKGRTGYGARPQFGIYI